MSPEEFLFPIQFFRLNQTFHWHLLKVLYRLTDPPSKELKQQKTAVVPKTAPSVIDDLKEYSPDTGGESGM